MNSKNKLIILRCWDRRSLIIIRRRLFLRYYCNYSLFSKYRAPVLSVSSTWQPALSLTTLWTYCKRSFSMLYLVHLACISIVIHTWTPLPRLPPKKDSCSMLHRICRWIHRPRPFHFVPPVQPSAHLCLSGRVIEHRPSNRLGSTVLLLLEDECLRVRNSIPFG